MKINKQFIWDYDLSIINMRSDSFVQWYIARVLVRGGLKDLKEIGFENIYKYLPALTLPCQLREFWEWYFSLPGIKQIYEHIERKPETGFISPVRSRYITR